jgi:hypothetical protein
MGQDSIGLSGMGQGSAGSPGISKICSTESHGMSQDSTRSTAMG